MIRAVIFDLDETLLNRSASLLRFIRSQYARHREKLAAVPLKDWTDLFIRLDAGGYVGKDRVYSRLLSEWPVPGLTAEGLLREFHTGFAPHSVAMPGMRTTLAGVRMRGLATGVVSNGFTRFQKENAARLGLWDWLDVLLVSEEEGVKKPAPAIFLRAAGRLGLPPGDCLFVGDHPGNDIAGARRAGMRTAWLAGPEPWPAEMEPPDATLRRLPDLLPVLDMKGTFPLLNTRSAGRVGRPGDRPLSGGVNPGPGARRA